jgi:hypothetical protein
VSLARKSVSNIEKVGQELRLRIASWSTASVTQYIPAILASLVIGKSNLFLNWEPRHKNAWWRGNTASPYLTSILNGSEWSASGSGRFNPVKHSPDTHCIRDCAGCRFDGEKCFAPSWYRTLIPPTT